MLKLRTCSILQRFLHHLFIMLVSKLYHFTLHSAFPSLGRMFASAAFWFSVRIYSLSLLQISKTIKRDSSCFLRNLFLITFLHVEDHDKVKALSLEDHRLLPNHAALRCGMSSDSACADSAHWETHGHVRVKTAGNAEFFMIAVVSLLTLTSLSQRR